MEKEFDVIALGELLIDFTMNGKSEQGNNLFERIRAEHRGTFLQYCVSSGRRRQLSEK